MRFASRMCRALLLLCASLSGASAAAPLPDSGFAEVTQPVPVIVPRLRYDITATYQSLFPADLERGGSAGSLRIDFRGEVAWRPTAEFSAGVLLHYDMQEWVFEPGPAFGTAPPWDALERGAVSAPIEFVLAPPMGLMISPFLEWAYEREAGASDALTYGARVGLLGVVSPGHRLGVGVTMHHQFFDTPRSYYWLVDWQLTDDLRLTNSVASGPLGPEGLEVAWTFVPRWEVAVGGVERSDRYRLEPEGREHGDIAESSGVPLYARVTFAAAPRLRADLYGGAVVSGRIRRWDPDGISLADEDVATVPLLAMTVSSHW